MQKTALEHDLHKLVEKALALGASGAKTVDVASIRTGAWTRWKCQFGCPNYGKTLCCPPFVPDYAATQVFTGIYQRDYHSVHFSFEWGGG